MIQIILVAVLLASLQERPPAVPVEPISAILENFQTYSVLALGEVHGDLNSLKLRLNLIRDPRFAGTVNDIVVEVGNARYQDVIDRYVRGEDVPVSMVREACRNTTNHNMGPDYPSFEEIFHAVRAINLALPPERRLRILLGDPPFDWSKVKTVHDLYRDDRDRFVADLILRESLAKRRRVLLVYGHMHFPRLRGNPPSIVTRLEAAGHKVFSIATLGPGAQLGQTDVFSWPRPSLALLRGTKIGAAEVPMFQPMIFEDRFDAVLIDAPAPGSLPREYCDDPDYVKMRSFRLGLRGESDQLSRHCGLK